MGNQLQKATKQQFIGIFEQDSPNEIFQSQNKFLSNIQSNNLLLMDQKDVRQIIQNKNFNFNIFLSQIIHQLDSYTAQDLKNLKSREFLVNTLKILIYILPILFEQKLSNQYDIFFWQEPQDQIQKCNGIKLIQALNNLLIMQYFTVNYTNVSWNHAKKINSHINDGKDYNYNRLLILKCLMCLFGQTLYNNECIHFFNPWIYFIISPFNKSLKLIVMSLIGQICQSNDSLKIPYQSIINSDEFNIIQDLALYCCQIKLIFLQTQDYKSSMQQFEKKPQMQLILQYYISQQPEIVEHYKLDLINKMFSNGTIEIISNIRSVFCFQLEDIKDETVLEFIIMELLERQIKRQLSFVPNQTEQICYNEEIYSIFYLILYHNPQDILGDIQQNHGQRIFQIVMFNFCQAFENIQLLRSYQNKLMISTFYFNILTKSAQFNHMLQQNINFNHKFKIFPQVVGNYGDYLVQNFVFAIIYFFNNKIKIQIQRFVQILQNVSPFLKNLNDVSANQLILLLDICSTYEFLLQSKNNPYCLVKLIDVLETILGFQMQNNKNLILEVYRKKFLFNRIYKLNFHEKQIKEIMKKGWDIQQQMDKQNGKNEKQGLIGESNENQFFTQLEQLTEDWKNFDWNSLKKQIKINNIQIIIKQIQDFVTKNNIPQLDLFYIKQIIEENNFLGLQQNIPLFNDEIYELNYSNYVFDNYIWTLICSKNFLYPKFDPVECVYFQLDPNQCYKGYKKPKDLDDIQLQKSINEFPSRFLQVSEIISDRCNRTEIKEVRVEKI